MTNANRLSRRRFAKLVGGGAAFAAWQTSGNRWTIGQPLISPTPSAGVVRLSSNENPYGPAPAALKAMTDSFGLAWRYPDEYQDQLASDLAHLNGIPNEQVLMGAGSGEILKLAAAAFTGPGKRLVMADPAFEAIGRHAGVSGAKVIKVPLTWEYAHDLPKMLGAVGGDGLIYICNPNNPTGSITPKAGLRSFIAKVPQHIMVVVDEAYHHYVESNDYESVMPLARDYPNLIVTRTFSKIYGLAGLRCGYCVTQPKNIKAMQDHQYYDSVSIMAIVAARASLSEAKHVSQGQRLNREVKEQVYAALDKLGYRYIPSHTNFMMIDLRREVKPVIAALKDRQVEVGRFFPALPNFLRVTIGTRPQMDAFLSAFREVAA